MHNFQIDTLTVTVAPDALSMGAEAARAAVQVMREAVAQRGSCRAIFASANSQLPLFDQLQTMDVPWESLEVLHMDEYIGLSPAHPASFSGFLHTHLLRGRTVRAFHRIDGMNPSPLAACANYDQVLRSGPIDLCCLGIGENGHLAFNEPDQADFDDPVSLKVVRLDPVSRQQQVGEGHFPDLASVPTHAITLTVPALLSAGRVIGVVPDTRKANALRNTLYGEIDPMVPATALRRSSQAHLFVDLPAASLLPDLPSVVIS